MTISERVTGFYNSFILLDHTAENVRRHLAQKFSCLSALYLALGLLLCAGEFFGAGYGFLFWAVVLYIWSWTLATPLPTKEFHVDPFPDAFIEYMLQHYPSDWCETEDEALDTLIRTD